jgi:hypothetical protein
MAAMLNIDLVEFIIAGLINIKRSHSTLGTISVMENNAAHAPNLSEPDT